MRRSLARVFAAAVVCACLLAALPSAGAVQTRSQGRARSLTMRAAPNATSTPAPPTAPAHKNGTRNSTVTPLRPAVECFSVDVCHSRCSLAYNRTKPLVVKPVIPEEFDSDRSHLSCCESGCSRRTPSSLTACEDQCARSPWIPDGALPTSEFDSTQEARGLEGRFPVYPTFLELSRRLSPHATDSVQSEEDELGARPVPTRRQRIMRFASNTTAPAANASAPASVLSARPNGTRPSNSTRPAPRPVEYLINLVPEAPRAANKSSPNAAQTEEDELAAAMRGLMPERAHIPADILQYMEGQARLAASIAKTQKTVYVTKAEKLRNLGEYHKQLCILGCRLRCKDPKPGSVPVPAAPRHSNGTSTATNATAAKPASPAPASVAPAPSNSTATKSSSVRQLLRLAQRVAAREEEEARASAESEASEADSEEGDGGQPESEADLSAFDEAPAPRQLSWDNPS